MTTVSRGIMKSTSRSNGGDESDRLRRQDVALALLSIVC